MREVIARPLSREEARLREVRPTRPLTTPTIPNADIVERACHAVGAFLDNAGPEDRALALEALQIAVRATTTEAEISGVVPIDEGAYPLPNTHDNARCTLATTPVGDQIRRAS